MNMTMNNNNSPNPNNGQETFMYEQRKDRLICIIMMLLIFCCQPRPNLNNNDNHRTIAPTLMFDYSHRTNVTMMMIMMNQFVPKSKILKPQPQNPNCNSINQNFKDESVWDELSDSQS